MLQFPLCITCSSLLIAVAQTHYIAILVTALIQLRLYVYCVVGAYFEVGLGGVFELAAKEKSTELTYKMNYSCRLSGSTVDLSLSKLPILESCQYSFKKNLK